MHTISCKILWHRKCRYLTYVTLLLSIKLTPHAIIALPAIIWSSMSNYLCKSYLSKMSLQLARRKLNATSFKITTASSNTLCAHSSNIESDFEIWSHLHIKLETKICSNWLLKLSVPKGQELIQEMFNQTNLKLHAISRSYVIHKAGVNKHRSVTFLFIF